MNEEKSVEALNKILRNKAEKIFKENIKKLLKEESYSVGSHYLRCLDLEIIGELCDNFNGNKLSFFDLLKLYYEGKYHPFYVDHFEDYRENGNEKFNKFIDKEINFIISILIENVNVDAIENYHL